MSLQESLKKFDEMWVGGTKPPIWNIFKDFLSQEIKTALESVVSENPAKYELPPYQIEPKKSFAEGYNFCRYKLIKDIENYLEN